MRAKKKGVRGDIWVCLGFDMETDVGSWTRNYKGLRRGTPKILNLLGDLEIYATFLGGQETDFYLIEYKGGERVLLQLKCPAHHFFLAVTTAKGITPIRLNAENLYEALLSKVIPFFRGEAEYPVPVAWSIETIRTTLACRQTRLTGRKFYLRELRLDDPGFDGTAFAKEYRNSKMGAAR